MLPPLAVALGRGPEDGHKEAHGQRTAVLETSYLPAPFQITYNTLPALPVFTVLAPSLRSLPEGVRGGH